MLLLLSGWVLIFGLAILSKHWMQYGDWREDAAFFSGLASAVLGVVLAFGLVAIPIQRMGDLSFLAKLEAVRSTVANAPLQDAAWRIEKAKWNSQLAEKKYYRASVFRDWVDPSIDAAKPLN